MGHRNHKGRMLAGILAVGMLLSSMPSVAYAVEGENGGAVVTEQEAAAEETGTEDENGTQGQEESETEDTASEEDGGEKEAGETVSENNNSEDESKGAEGIEAEEPREEAAEEDTLSEQAETVITEATAAEGEETSGSCGANLTWKFENGVLTISGSGAMYSYYSGSGNGDFVPWYEYRNNIKRAVVEEGVSTIGIAAFLDCSSLTSIELPSSVTFISASTFEGCSSLTSIELPLGIMGIGSDAFSDCSSLTGIELPSGVMMIGNAAFKECSSLTSIKWPSSVTFISASTFEGCSSLTSIELPSGITEVRGFAFSGCSSLTRVELPPSVTTIGQSAFDGCSSLTSIEMSPGVTNIGDFAFYNCSSLTDIKLPTGVTTVEKSAFSGCSKLANIELPSSVTNIGDFAFYNCSSLTSIELPPSVTTVKWRVFSGCSSLTNIKLPLSITNIEGYAFENCNRLTGIELPSGVTTIGEHAFLNCSSLTDIELQTGVTTIGKSAFCDCSSLTRIELPSGVTIVEDATFLRCSNLTRIELPLGVTSIGYSAFEACSSLKDVYYGGSENDWRAITIRAYNEPFTSATLHCALNDSESDSLKWGLDANGMLTISGTGKMADYREPDAPAPWNGQRNQIKTIVISQGVTSIGTSAFSGCTNLTEITVPKSVVSIGDSAFSGCGNLARVRFLGTKEQLESIAVGADNEKFLKASRSWIQPGTGEGTNVQTLKDVYYYDTIAKAGVKTDLTWQWNFLNGKPSICNTSLAEMGVVLSAAIEHSSSELVDILMAKNGDMTNNLGCDGVTFDATGSPGAAFAHRTVTDASGKTGHVIFVVIRGTENGGDTVNDLLSVLGWSDWGTAGVYSKLGDYLTDCRKSNKDMKLENTKFFVTGHSLGGACANIVAKKLSDEYGTDKVYAYTFGTPSPFGSEQENNYTNIHNFLCWDDHVPLWLLGTKYPWCGYGYYTWFYQDESPETETGYHKLTGKRWQETYEENNGFLGLGLHAPSIYLAFLQTHPEFEPRAGIFHVYYMRAKCPVDIEVYDSANELVGRITNDEVDSASRASGVVLTVIDGQKSVYFAKDDTYTVRITGTGEGTMTFTAASADLNSGIVEEEKIFSNVRIADGKKLESQVGLYDETDATDAVKIADVELHVINGNGDRVAKVLSDQEADAQGKDKGSEIALDQTDGVLPGDIPADGKIPDGLWIAGVEASYPYTGAAIKPEIRVYDGKKKLQPGKDYTVSYKNNTKANDAVNLPAAPAVVVKGKGNYAGTETATFKITAAALDGSSVAAEDITVAYNKKVQKKVPVVTYNGRKLAKDRDFTVSYPNTEPGAYKEPGTYEIILTAKTGGSFRGTRTVICTITDSILLGKVNVKKIPDQTYIGKAIEPELTVTYKNTALVKGTDYAVSYTDHTEIGTAKAVLTGIGKYAGTKKVSFRIKGTSINGAVVSGIENKVYNGNDQEQNITVALNGRTLEAGCDYETVYAGNREVGKASLTIKGKGAYTGTIKKTFRIGKFDIAANRDGRFTAEVKQETVPYAKGGAKPEVTVRFRTGDGGWRTLSEGQDYTLSYRNHTAVNDGSKEDQRPAVTVKGKGNYSGTYGTALGYKIAAQDLGQLIPAAQDKVYQSRKNSYTTRLSITDLNGKVLQAGKDYLKEFNYLYANETAVSRASGEMVIRTAGTVVDKEDIIPAGTVLKVRATAKAGGNYTGTLEGEYRITKASIASASVSIPKQIYTGQPITLEKNLLAVKIKGNQLDASQYEIVPGSYKNNVKKGTASMTIRGTDNYGGTKTVRFTIRAKGFLWWWR